MAVDCIRDPFFERAHAQILQVVRQIVLCRSTSVRVGGGDVEHDVYEIRDAGPVDGVVGYPQNGVSDGGTDLLGDGGFAI
ncbi:hypothetical protein LTR16_012380, partial [Cryomyces antarcticus]